MMRIAAGLVMVFSSLLLAACGSQPVRAPVLDRAPQPAATQAAPAKPEAHADATYIVKRGDTMFSIALDHGLDYKDLAAWNNMQDPNRIRVGQPLRIKPPAAQQEASVTVRPVTSAGRVETRPLGPPDASKTQAAPAPAARTDGAGHQGTIKSEPQGRKLPYTQENLALLQRGSAASAPQSAPPPAPAATPSAPPAPKPEPGLKPEGAVKSDADVDEENKVDWGRPAKGKIIAGFSEPINKGIDIEGKSGDPVLAAASGRVIYSGEMRGYGKLIVIKHNTFSSVYAHSSAILVKEGQSVVKGQKIAEIGSTDSDKPKLHFEIRKLGKPVDPARYLPPT